MIGGGFNSLSEQIGSSRVDFIPSALDVDGHKDEFGLW